MLRKFFQPQSDYARNIMTMMQGTTLAQAIPLFASLLITRLYLVEDFGVFNVVISISAILSVVATGKYELAILLPEGKKESRDVGALSLGLSLIFSVFVAIIVVFFRDSIAAQLKISAVNRDWLLVIPIFILIQGVFQTMVHFAVRNKGFKQLSHSKILDGLLNNGLRVGQGFFGAGVIGLIMGTALGQLSAIFILSRLAAKKKYFWLKGLNWSDVKQVGQRYINFPKHMVASKFFNVFAQQSPHFLLSGFFGPAISGFYGLTFRVVKLPVAVIASAFTEVYKQAATEEVQTFGHCRNVFFKTLKKLALIGILPFALLFVLAPELFAFVFSDSWLESGMYARLLAIPIFLDFVITPLSSTFFIIERTELYLRIQFSVFLLVVLSFLVGTQIMDSAIWTIGFLAGAYSVGYLLMLTTLILLIRRKKEPATP